MDSAVDFGLVGTLFEMIPSELQTVVLDYAQAFQKLIDSPFTREEIRAMIPTLEQIITISCSKVVGYSFEIHWWNVCSGSLSISNKMYMAYDHRGNTYTPEAITPPREASVDEAMIRMAGKHGLEISGYREPRTGKVLYPNYDETRVNRQYGWIGIPLAIIHNHTPSVWVSPETLIDIKSLFGMFKRRFETHHIPSPGLMARIQTLKFLDYIFERWMENNWVSIDLYLSACITALGIDIPVQFINQRMTSEFHTMVRDRATMCYEAVRKSVEQLH